MPNGILFLGDGGVGKSCIIDRLLNIDNFESRYLETFGIHKVNYKDNIEIYEYPGQERWSPYNTNYIDSSELKLCILVYDTTSELSYKNILKWKKNLQSYILSNKLGNKVKTFIVGNKTDIKTRKLKNKTFEISTKLNKNIDKLREKIDMLLRD